MRPAMTNALTAMTDNQGASTLGRHGNGSQAGRRTEPT